MNHAYIVTGEVKDGRTVTLDESLPLAPMRVRLVVEPLAVGSQASYKNAMSAIRARQSARQHQPRTRTKIDASLTAERASWDD